MATKGMVIQLNREQRVFLLKALKDGYIDLDALYSVGIRPASRFENMTDEELEDEIVRLSIIERGLKPIYEDKQRSAFAKVVTKRVVAGWHGWPGMTGKCRTR